MAINQTDVLEDLSFLLGESTVPTSGIDDRKRFIQRTLREVWTNYPWEFAKTSATFAVSSGTGSLPTNVMQDTAMEIRQVVSGDDNDYIYTQVPFDEKDEYHAGDYKYWLTGYEGALVLNTKESNATLDIRYTTTPPVVNASLTAPFPDAMPIALGALRYVRIGENPEADISQEESNFQRRLEEVWANYNMNKPRGERKTWQRKSGHFTGMI
jgi:hypothetical protein